MTKCFVLLCFTLTICFVQSDLPDKKKIEVLDNSYSDNSRFFSLDLLCRMYKTQQKSTNLLLSPMTIWTVLLILAEGASGNTLTQILTALQLSNDKKTWRLGSQQSDQLIITHSNATKLERFNGIFVDRETSPLLEDFQTTTKTFYNTSIISVNFKEMNESVVDVINNQISEFTHGKIPKLVEDDYFKDSGIILTSALYFHGDWLVPFNKSSTSEQPFYDSFGKKIGEVSMMYNKYAYGIINMNEMNANFIELPYHNRNLSMLIILPHPRETIQNVLMNLRTVSFDEVLSRLQRSSEEQKYFEDEVQLYLPKFKITSNLVLTDVLKRFGIVDLFDKFSATLPFLSNSPLYVKKIVQKAVIEVTEEGTEAAAVTTAEFANRIDSKILINRPFIYLIVEKTSKTVVFSGVYETPS